MDKQQNGFNHETEDKPVGPTPGPRLRSRPLGGRRPALRSRSRSFRNQGGGRENPGRKDRTARGHGLRLGACPGVLSRPHPPGQSRRAQHLDQGRPGGWAGLSAFAEGGRFGRTDGRQPGYGLGQPGRRLRPHPAVFVVHIRPDGARERRGLQDGPQPVYRLLPGRPPLELLLLPGQHEEG
jgi:hypothetical protein